MPMTHRSLLIAVLIGSLAGGSWVQAKTAAPTAPAAPSEADWRTPDPQDVLVIETNRGRIIVELTPEVAPLAAARLRDLTRAGFYDGRSFFRVIDGFMDQSGDPTDTGAGGSSQPNLPAEFTFRRGPATPMVAIERSNGLDIGVIGATPVTGQTLDLAAITADQKVSAWPDFCPGVVGMARAEDPGSANSQFFLMRGDNRSLDQRYTAAGRVVAGMDVVRAIKTGEPVDPPQDKIETARVLADMPAAERPKLRLINPAGPWFAAMVVRVKAEKSNSFSICDLDLPADLK